MGKSQVAGLAAPAVSSSIPPLQEAAMLLNAANGLAAKGELTPAVKAQLENAVNKLLSQGANQPSGAAIPSAHVAGAISAVSGAAGHAHSSGVGSAFPGASAGVGQDFGAISILGGAAGHAHSSGVGSAFASGRGALARVSAGVGQAFGATPASGAVGHVKSSGIAGAVPRSPLIAENAAMAELAALKSNGAPPEIIAQVESKIENLKDLSAAEALSVYAHDTGRHIKPNGSLDLAGIKGDYTAPPAVRGAAARALHAEQMNSSGVGPAFAGASAGVGQAFGAISAVSGAVGHAHSSGVGSAFASGRGALARVSAGVGQAFGATPASGAVGHVKSSGIAGAVPRSPLIAENAAMAELAALKSNGAPPEIIAQVESKIENLKDLSAAEALSVYAHDTGRHIKPNGSLDLAGIKGDYTAPPAVRDAAARALHAEQMNAKDPVYASH